MNDPGARAPESDPQTHEITALLAALSAGDRAAFDEIYDRLYAELRRIAEGQLARAAHGAGETLSTTALVHEAYVKLVGAHLDRLTDRQHFFAIAARAMRQIILDAARRRLADKRGAGGLHIELGAAGELPAAARAAEFLALEEALSRLGGLDDRLERLVELRFYTGLSVEETAELLGVSDRTVKRDWRRAKAFLQHELGTASA